MKTKNKYVIVQEVDNISFSQRIEKLEEQGYIREGSFIMTIYRTSIDPDCDRVILYEYLLNQMMIRGVL